MIEGLFQKKIIRKIYKQADLSNLMEGIQIIGIDKLQDDLEKSTVNKLSAEYYEKIKRAINNEVLMTVHIKEHTKGGTRKKSDIRVKVAFASNKVVEAQESDWDLARTLHKVFKNIERELQHKFKTDDTRKKPYA